MQKLNIFNIYTYLAIAICNRTKTENVKKFGNHLLLVMEIQLLKVEKKNYGRIMVGIKRFTQQTKNKKMFKQNKSSK